MDRATELLPQTDLASKCLRDVVLPSGDIVIDDEFPTGVENYKEFFYALVGIAGEGQNFDGNGMYVRFQTGGGSQSVSLGSQSSSTGQLFGNNPEVPLGNRPAYPGKRPPYKPYEPCYKQQIPDVNGPAAAKSLPTGAPAHRAGRPAARQAAQGSRPQRRAQEAEPVRRQAGAGAGEGQVRTAIRKHLPDFLAIIGLLIIAIAVATVILGKQRLTLPAWVPLIGQDFFMIEAEMSTAQAITPGQGQTVNVAGVEVGEIASVKLRDGKAIIGMKIQPRYARIYKDASILLRPKTGLKDMVAELTPGTQQAGRLEEGAVIPVSQTLPDVNLDEILATLDADTRDFLGAAAQRRRRRARLGGQGPASWRRRSGAWSRPRSTRARSTSSWPCGAGTWRASCTTSRC